MRPVFLQCNGFGGPAHTDQTRARSARVPFGQLESVVIAGVFLLATRDQDSSSKMPEVLSTIPDRRGRVARALQGDSMTLRKRSGWPPRLWSCW